MRAARPMGVYYDMPFDDYHAVDAVSASGLLCRACNTMLGQMLDKDLKRYGIQTAKAEGAA